MATQQNVQAPVGARHRARQCALQLLFQLDGSAPAGGTPALDLAISFFWENVDPEAAQTKETVRFTERLVHGVMDHLPEVDGAISAKSRNWRLERMARVDRNVLRLSTFELLYLDTIPGQIILNEAVELAKQFGTEESSAFVNGILGRMAEELGR